ncbi:4-alpha-glucanotransferase, partial [Acidisphaera sp. L21]|uniref:4-alpha-glucanotransferase n=1 Tax=Acidisphaera sp. L21 TaxID=1641851 RepID=UPI0020B131C5
MSLHALAEAGGLALRWKDVHGEWHEVADESLRLVLSALGLPAATEREIADSLQSLRDPGRLPPLVTGEAGGTITLAVLPGAYEFTLEDGGVVQGHATGDTEATIRLPTEAGYHQLSIGKSSLVVAVAPTRCWTVADAAPRGAWGLAAQLYSLRRAGDGGLGDFGALADFVRNAAAHGAAAVAISPAHAQFSATLDRFSPYSPSSRTLLNVLHARLDIEPVKAGPLESMEMVDWPAATALRLAHLDAAFAKAEQGGPVWDAFQDFRTAQGDGLVGHARFEALHAAMTVDGGPWHWRD